MTDRTLGSHVVWENCDPAVVRELIKDLRVQGPNAFRTMVIREARQTRLPFYKNLVLVDVQLLGVTDHQRVFVLHGPGETFWLDGSSANVHAVNALESIELDASSVLEYVRFFLFAIRAEHGAFTLIEAPEDIDVSATSGGSAPPRSEQDLAALRAQWQPLRLGEQNADGSFRVHATVAYGEGLFSATFVVQKDGEIEMVDDDPLGDLTGFEVPSYPALALQPPEPEPASAVGKESGLAAALAARTEPVVVAPAAAESAPDDRQVTESAVSVLLSQAVGASLGHRLLQHFNTESQATGPIGQLSRFVREFAPIIVIESEIPFIEDIVVGLLDPSGKVFDEDAIRHASAVSGDDARCYVDLRTGGAAIHLISFHAYRSLWDAEWTAHQLAVGSKPVLVGCERRADVPEALRRVTDLFLTLPRIDEKLFSKVFQKVLGVAPRWRSGGGDWVRYLVHSDFHALRRLRLSAVDAIAYLRERAQSRLAQVTPAGWLKLDQLHGLGEARQVADDLIADIAAARAGRIPWSAVDRGLLLVGAPGTGKTTLARAIAQACRIKFVRASAADWQSAGALDQHLRAIRATFSEARRYAPAILFIDEIDSIGNRERFSGSNAIYQTEVVNGVLEQIQGMDEDEPVIVIGATNYLDSVDPALRRAGRLDQVVTLPRPSVAGLEKIFKFHLAPYRAARKMAANVRVRTLAQLAFGLTGADVEFFVRGAARRARKERRRISQEDLVAEITRRPRRPDSVISLTPEDMQRVAAHEAGHAISALKSSSGAREVTYVSIIPRMDGSLGFTASPPPEGAVTTRTDVLDRLRTIMAGRAAEEVVYGRDNVSLSAGGSEQSDLAVATRIATNVICTSGFSTSGSLHWTATPTSAQLEQVEELLRNAYRAAVDLLRDHRPVLDRVVDALVEHQELDGETLRRLLGP